MRQTEILNLTWQEIDLKRGFIRLGGDRTKNKVGRNIPLHPRIVEYLQSCPRPIHGGMFLVRVGGLIERHTTKPLKQQVL